MLTVGGIPAHPLVVHAAVVLLPLAAIGAVVVALRPSLRRSLGIPLALVTIVGVLAVPIATRTGDQLREALGGGSPLVEVHEERADNLLPWAVLFGLLVLVSVVVGRMADRAAAAVAEIEPIAAGGVGPRTGATAPATTRATTRATTQTATRAAIRAVTLRRVATTAGLLAALAGIAVAALVVWIGDAGAQSVWQGVGG
ncbi:hypothetical protein Psed_1518 [Pseudonocardia dioxanivorans CB1190]|uniref:DUF2231 domain-containing protein n=1 Tax=Pseudonocardia dioxanivorans (strain ATCC 55486 / DSM 44775 / JCM 13855 / CB1190) TaxID=675635 RepID=F4CU38_PSEUX|nr:DUF2231 domain-containing protein [Pseudonocardia dioxanivorans]AEA23757.1 hypothetical protein Psed_1518 [Pseudonocardia dioxanivorans CB1190]